MSSIVTKYLSTHFAKAIAGKTAKSIDYAYIEFWDPSLAANAPPSLSAEDSTPSYYLGLDGVLKDFVRVPLLGSWLATPAPLTYPEGHAAEFVFACDPDGVGYRGMATLGATYVGAAYVIGGATPAEDIVIGRTYLEVGERVAGEMPPFTIRWTLLIPGA